MEPLNRLARRKLIAEALKKEPRLGKAAWNAGYIRGVQDESKRITWAAFRLSYDVS